ncbi:MAG TPA: 3-dehydroquinate synthase, partial [Gemmatimonadales bacterium]|nr:3-dehydroquinate synthase [Gemmatimonadales bacterium]
MVTIRIPLAERRDASYDIVIGRGLLDGLTPVVRAACPASRYAVITDSHVSALYGGRLVARLCDASLPAELFEFPAGEWNKTRESWAVLSDRLLARQFGRDAAVIALGGGVVGDVAGFVAATYLRGIPYVQVPTTLLAMIDSSVGGKTGVDVPAGKNLLGAFHQPRLVIADLDVLVSLPQQQLAAGMAEAVKHGVIGDAAYFATLERDVDAIAARQPEALERMVRRSVEIKADVVAADERDAGQRAVLNFGHTVGHAIEATARFAALHGEAVAIGMAYEARLAEVLGIAERGTTARLVGLLERYRLPCALPDTATVDALIAAMQL